MLYKQWCGAGSGDLGTKFDQLINQIYLPGKYYKN